jgi:hypothetical protein
VDAGWRGSRYVVPCCLQVTESESHTHAGTQPAARRRQSLCPRAALAPSGTRRRRGYERQRTGDGEAAAPFSGGRRGRPRSVLRSWGPAKGAGRQRGRVGEGGWAARGAGRRRGLGDGAGHILTLAAIARYGKDLGENVWIRVSFRCGARLYIQWQFSVNILKW